MRKTTFILWLLSTLYASMSFDLSAEVISSEIKTPDGMRSYRLFVPAGVPPNGGYPLVFHFHGTGGTPERQVGLSNIEVLAEQEKFFVVSPQAVFSYEENGRKTWNVEKIEGGADDVAFIEALIDSLIKRYSIAQHRIYATGFSGGARMSSRLACDLSEQIAAIAPVAGIRFPSDCDPAQPMPVLSFHGEKDPVNHYKKQESSPRYWNHGVEAAVTGWVSANKCSIFPTVAEVNSSVSRYTFQNCTGNAKIDFYLSKTAGHTWPGTPAAELLAKYGMGKTDDIAGTRIIWEFLKAHERRP